MEKFIRARRHAFTRAVIDGAPDQPGVYCLFDGDELVYIGKANERMSIKTCLLLHQDGSLGPCTSKATACAWEVTIWPSARETELLAKFFLRNRRDPRCQSLTP